MKIPLTTKTIESTDGNVKITFWRGWTKHPRLGKFRHTTHCDIGVGLEHSQAPSWTHPRDSYQFENGARESFKKAVATLPKSLRRGPWELYLREIEKFEVVKETEQTA